MATQPPPAPTPELCNCLALRQASRRLSQYYDEIISPSGVRGAQFSILSRLNRMGPLAINAFAASLQMDRTTLARNLLPLQRAGLVVLKSGKDRRSREVHLTDAGRAAYQRAAPLWQKAQAGFTERFGTAEAANLRDLMRHVTNVIPDSEAAE